MGREEEGRVDAVGEETASGVSAGCGAVGDGATAGDNAACGDVADDGAAADGCGTTAAAGDGALDGGDAAAVGSAAGLGADASGGNASVVAGDAPSVDLASLADEASEVSAAPLADEAPQIGTDFKRPYLTRRSFIGGAVAAVAAAAGVAAAVAYFSHGEEDVPSEPTVLEDASSAKLGGKLTLYTCCDETLINAFVPAFMQETGVAVEVVDRTAAQCRDEVAAEVAAGSPAADVVWGGDASWYAAGEACFDKYMSGENSSVIKEYRNVDGYVTPVTREVCVIAVNKAQADMLGVTIDGFASLTDARLTGQLAVSDPATDAAAKSAIEALRAVGNTLAAYATTDGEGNAIPGGDAFLSAVWAQAGGNVRATSADALQDVVAGAAVAAIVYEQAARAQESATGQVEIVYPSEGCLLVLGCTAVVRGATNLEQARAWVDFVCSEAGQKAAADKVALRSIREGVGEKGELTGIAEAAPAAAGAGDAAATATDTSGDVADASSAGSDAADDETEGDADGDDSAE